MASGSAKGRAMNERCRPSKTSAWYEALIAAAARSGEEPDERRLEELRFFGQQAAADGRTLRSLVVDHLALARVAWPDVAVDAGRVLAAMQQGVEALCEGHERAQQFAVRQQEAVRREFIDDLLYGRSELGSLVERAERFGLRLSYAHAVAVAVAEGTGAYVEGDVVSRRVERAVTGRFGERSVLLTTKNGRMVCIAPGDQHEVLLSFAEQAHAAAEGGRTAIGRPHAGAGGIVHSYQEALQVLDLADRLGFAEPVLHGADLLVYPVLARDRQALADLVRTTFGALLEARGGPQPYLETFNAYFDAGCVGAQAARRLALSVRALTYRLRRIHQLTGSDPTDPEQRYRLQTAVIGARLLDWPAQSR
ncbi:helix-turn-helix domain-containing protein [Streptomyces microflavus]|nr:helix-turn-helix domain-containing protein [Streptomyces microflavus]MCX4657166.1 helix-turn-helix domain-containing protein [Streptomyces microflavus]